MGNRKLIATATLCLGIGMAMAGTPVIRAFSRPSRRRPSRQIENGQMTNPQPHTKKEYKDEKKREKKLKHNEKSDKAAMKANEHANKSAAEQEKSEKEAEKANTGGATAVDSCDQPPAGLADCLWSAWIAAWICRSV